MEIKINDGETGEHRDSFVVKNCFYCIAMRCCAVQKESSHGTLVTHKVSIKCMLLVALAVMKSTVLITIL